ncbi:MAG: polysaccharide biosynthesis C-terminal domain-containing protein [Candidatus Velthaea sp.]
MIEPLEESVAAKAAAPAAAPPRVSMITAGVVTLASRIAVILLSAVTGIISARMLGPAERGLYVIPGIEASFVFATFSGLSVAVSYFMLNRSAGRGALRPALLTAAGLIAAGSGVITVMGVTAHATWSIAPAITALVPYAALNVASGYFLGRARVVTNTLLMSSLALATFVFITAALVQFGARAAVAVNAWLVALFVVAIAGAVLVWSDARFKPNVPVPFREFSAYALKIGLTNLTSLLNYRIDVYLVALYTKPADLAVYTLAVMAAELVGTFTQVVPQITLPEIGRLNIAESADYTARWARANVALAGIACAGLFVLAPYLITIAYGEAFAGAVQPLRVLLIGAFAMAPCSLFSTYFTIKLGRPRLPLVINVSSAVVSAAIGVVLIPRIGVMGGAVATAVSYVLGTVIALVYFARISGMSVPATMLVRREDLVLLQGILRRLRSRCAF